LVQPDQEAATSGLSAHRDCSEPLELSVTEAAHRPGVSCKQLSDVANARAGISPENGSGLDKAFGGGETWPRLQAAYDLARAWHTPTGSTSNEKAVILVHDSCLNTARHISRSERILMKVTRR
jgi:addiction module HigA family antidote